MTMQTAQQHLEATTGTEHIGTSIRAFRQRLGLSMQAVADRCANLPERQQYATLTRMDVWDIELGMVAPSIEQLACIILVLTQEGRRQAKH